MHRKPLISALLILCVLSLSSCARVQINDHEICGDKGKLGASCFNMLSDGSRKLSFDDWAIERFGQLCMQADAFANIKAALLKLCESSKRCTWEEKQQIANLGSKMEMFSQDLKALNDSNL